MGVSAFMLGSSENGNYLKWQLVLGIDHKMGKCVCVHKKCGYYELPVQGNSLSVLQSWYESGVPAFCNENI